jgi:hypothetical protein
MEISFRTSGCLISFYFVEMRSDILESKIGGVGVFLE